MAKKRPNTMPFWRFLFLVYCSVMFWLLFYRSHSWNLDIAYKELLQQNTNLIPFRTIENYRYVLQHSTDAYMRAHCFLNLAGNVLLFMPAGWLLPKIWKRKRNFFRFFALSSGLLFLIETVQLFSLLGRFDVDDLILNLLGMTAGFLLYTIFRKT